MIVIAPLGQTGASRGQRVGLGATYASSRPMHLQKAVTWALTEAADLTAFPGKHVEIPAERFDDLVRQVLEKANGDNPANWRTFQEAEAARDLAARGYDRGLLAVEPIVITAAPVVELPFPLAPIIDIPRPPPPGPIILPPQPTVEPPTAQYVILPVPGPPDISPMPATEPLPGITDPTMRLPVERPAPGFDKKWLIVAGLAAIILTRSTTEAA